MIKRIVAWAAYMVWRIYLSYRWFKNFKYHLCNVLCK